RLLACAERQSARGGGDAEGDPCAGKPSGGAEQSPGCREGASVDEASARGRARREAYRGDADLLPLPFGALAEAEDEQSDGAAAARSQAADQSGGRVPGRTLCSDARRCSAAARVSHEL